MLFILLIAAQKMSPRAKPLTAAVMLKKKWQPAAIEV
jgi:hypothetical protein